MKDENRDTNSVPYNFGHYKQAVTGPSPHSTIQHPKREWTYSYLPEIYVSFLFEMPLIWKSSMGFKILTYIFRSVEL